MNKMADDDPWLLKEDGCLNVDTECKSIIYHANLNVLLITTSSAQVYVFDVNSGVILQRSSLSGKSNGKLQGVYLSDGIDKVLYTDGRGIGIRSDYNGVLLLDTILQTPVSKSEDVVKLELLLSEAALLLQCLQCVELPGVDHLLEVLQELTSKIVAAQTNQKKGIKAQKWNTICLELPHGSLKLVCSGLVMELKRQNRHIPALPIASAINERLNGLLPGLALEGGPTDRALMFSEAARRDTFPKWPHMNYKETEGECFWVEIVRFRRGHRVALLFYINGMIHSFAHLPMETLNMSTMIYDSGSFKVSYEEKYFDKRIKQLDNFSNVANVKVQNDDLELRHIL